MKAIRFANHDFVLDPSGLLIWPSEKIAAVGDLHFEKGSYFAMGGQMLPQKETEETLQRLNAALEFSCVRKLILLGDSFHDPKGYDRLESKTRTIFDHLCMQFETIWVIGNHDGDFVPDGLMGYPEFKHLGIVFRHEAVRNARQEISGHYHPKANLKLRGARISRPCFVHDDHKMIIPAFGTLTGGMDVCSPEISELFEDDFTAHLLGENKIYSIPSTKLYRKK